MRKCSLVVVVAVATLLVQAGFAQKNNELNNPLPRHMPTKARYIVEFARPGGGGASNLSYHGGLTITSAKVVPIFWGSSWSTDPNANAIAQSLTKYIDGGSGATGYGNTGEYNVITQYYDSTSGNIKLSDLSQSGGAIYDSNNNKPLPTNVTDADIQAEVLKVVGTPRADTIYEVFLPSTSYSSSGTATSCGGPNLTYCAYHGNFNFNGTDTKYASMPYPSCGGCQSTGFSATQNFEHFISHETREAVTDEDGNAWFDRRGYEADDKCAWSPTPFTDANTGSNVDGTAFAYQYEWSNATSSCVKTR